MADQKDNAVALEILFQTLEENPELWETRKKTAKLLFADERYLEAADILWNAPEIPATDIDVAFALKIIARVKPNRSIRLIYEVVRRNQEKPHKNLAVAKALNAIGMYMEAARFYGAALASDSSLFDLAFERQILWLDDSGRLLEEWQKTDQASKPPLDVPEQELTGGMITPGALPEDTQAAAVQNAGNTQSPVPAAQAVPQPLSPPANTPQPMTAPAPPATRPLMVAGGAPSPAGQMQTTGPLQAGKKESPVSTQPLLTAQPKPAATGTAPLAVPAAQPMQPTATAPLSVPAKPVSTQPLAVAKPVAPATNPLLGANAPTKTQPLLTPGAGAPNQKLLTSGGGTKTQPLITPKVSSPTQPLAIPTTPLATTQQPQPTQPVNPQQAPIAPQGQAMGASNPPSPMRPDENVVRVPEMSQPPAGSEAPSTPMLRRQPSMLSSPPVASQPVAQPTATQPIAYAPVPSAPMQQMPTGYMPATPAGTQPVATQPLVQPGMLPPGVMPMQQPGVPQPAQTQTSPPTTPKINLK